MVELLADLIQNPAFKPEDVKGAAQLALLESRREQDAVDRAAIEKLFATAFTANRSAAPPSPTLFRRGRRAIRRWPFIRIFITRRTPW